MELPKNHDKLLHWIYSRKLKTSEGKPFEWIKHRYMLDPLCDFHPTQGWNKAGQMGASECVILKADFVVQELHLTTLYTLPNDNFVQTFSKTKFEPIINKNRHAFPKVSGGMMVKQFGEDNAPDTSFLIFLGAHLSQSEDDAQSSSKGVAVTVHCIINDERSKSHPFVIDQAISRTLNSPYKWNWSFDNPTFPGAGADTVYRKSDKRVWIVKCSRCGWNQKLDWFKLSQFDHVRADHCYIDDSNNQIICGKCAKPLSDYDRIMGRWVALFPSIKDYRGYWFNQLMNVNHSVEYLLKEEQDRLPSYFENMIMGRPYIGAEVGINREIILNNTHPGANTTIDEGQNFMGVDVGNVKHYVIGNHQGIFLVGTTKSWEEIERLMLTYNCKAVIDANPDQKAKQLAQKYPGRVWRAVYKNDIDGGALIDLPDHDRTIIRIRREEMFDYIANKFNANDMAINLHINQLSDYVSHWEAIHRFIKSDTYGNERFFWETSNPNDDDHFPHATVYFEAAKTRGGKGKSSIQKFKVQGDRTYVQSPVSTPASIIKDFKK